MDGIVHEGNGILVTLVFDLKPGCTDGKYDITLYSNLEGDNRGGAVNADGKVIDYHVVSGEIVVSKKAYEGAEEIQFAEGEIVDGKAVINKEYTSENQMPNLTNVPDGATVLYTVTKGEEIIAER